MPLVNQVFDPEPAESVSLTQFPDAVNGLGNRMPFDLLDGSPLHDFLDVPIKLQAASLRLSSKLGFDFGLQLNLDHRFYPPSSGNTTFREYDLPGIRLYGPTAFILLAQNSYGVDAQPSTHVLCCFLALQTRINVGKT